MEHVGRRCKHRGSGGASPVPRARDSPNARRGGILTSSGARHDTVPSYRRLLAYSFPRRSRVAKQLNARAIQIALLLFGSGMCALAYQIAWLRELRLVFGGSTAASAAVLAIFMGGLGVGGAVLGRWADKVKSPLRLYANLEILAALAAGVSPFLLDFVRAVYIDTGGSLVLGLRNATLLRLGLAAMVLGIPTFLMGGALPAAVRAAEHAGDVGRNRLALLYGANTFGAVFGAFCSTFFLLESFGTRNTLWLACLVNLLVAVTARSLARKPAEEPEAPRAPEAPFARQVPPLYVLASAGVAGFAFFLMEIVWYRMLAPLLGGTTYTFGLILAVALLGIGIGGAAYAFAGRNRPATLDAFAATLALEALFVAIPFALGDRVAVLAHTLRELSSMGFYGHVFGWGLVTSLVILPAAVISGFQFPLLISLLGQGERDVGRQTGYAYAWNTGGAILGSLAGGFGGLPLLGALGLWRVAVVLLGVMAGAAMAISYRRRPGLARHAVPVAAVALSVWMVFAALGPTAAWRHSGIGAGRSTLDTSSRNGLIRSLYDARRHIRWEADGVESSVGLDAASGVSFIINGKNDGNARLDASTQVMLGLLSALFHPEPRSSFVIGLGSGSTAGWLGAVDTMERVDVAELEPAIEEIAARSESVNHDALRDEKVRIHYGDAREFLLTSPNRYDLIVSEPSNPYRAGIASLYTQEFYRAVAKRLSEDGLFTQWVQAYEIDAETFQIIYATLASVFASVETWQTNDLDLLLICSNEPARYSVAEVSDRMSGEPFASALLYTWNVDSVEGLFSRYVASDALPRSLIESSPVRLNTDDRTLVEFGFARTVGQDDTFSVNELRRAAYEQGASRPAGMVGEIDWDSVAEQRLHMAAILGHPIGGTSGLPPDQRQRVNALSAFIDGGLADVYAAWNAQPREPKYPVEVAMVAEAFAEAGDARALEFADEMEKWFPAVSQAVRARYLRSQGRLAEAVDELCRVYESLRVDPWPIPLVMERALKLGQTIAAQEPALAPVLLEGMSQPFAAMVFEEYRMELLVDLASHIGFETAAEHIESFEPNVLWTEEFLKFRALCYEAVDHPLAARAQRDLDIYRRNSTQRFADLLAMPQGTTAAQ